MKRMLIILISVIVLGSNVFASERCVNDVGMTLTIPESYVVKTTLDYSDDYKLVFLAMEEETKTYFVITDFRKNSSADFFLDFRTCSKEDLEYYTDAFLWGIKENRATSKGSILSEHAKYMKYYIYKEVVFEKEILSAIVYYTYVQGCQFKIVVFSDGLSADELLVKEKEFDDIVKSICFDDTLKKMQAERKAEYEAERALEERRARNRNILAICTIVPVLLVATVFITLSVRKKRREKVRDAELQAKVTKYCRACGAAMADEAELCSNCGMRQ